MRVIARIFLPSCQSDQIPLLETARADPSLLATEEGIRDGEHFYRFVLEGENKLHRRKEKVIWYGLIDLG